MTLAIRDGVIRGMFVIGQNPAVGGHNAQMVQRGLAEARLARRARHRGKRNRLVLVQGAAGAGRRIDPEDIATEVFLMPAALAGEKDGTLTNTHRLMQWHDKVVEAPGDSRSESCFIFHLGAG